MIGALTLLAASTLQAPLDVGLRTEVRPEGDVWIGQRTSIYVTVRMAERPEVSPRFGLPTVEGAFLWRAPGSPLLGSERIDGTEYTTQRYELMLFPQRPGELRVAPIQVRVELAGEMHELSTGELAIRALAPEGYAPGVPLVTSTNVKVEERFEPPLVSGRSGVARVGDAWVRTVTLQARNVMGLALPPLVAPELTGVAVYGSEPEVEDVLRRGALQTTRRDRQTLVFEQAGAVELPPLRYRWWNPDARRMEERTLEAVTVEVAAAPVAPVGPVAPGGALEAELTGTGSTPRALDPWRAAGIALGLLLAVVALPGARRRVRARAESRARSELGYFERLLRACRASDRRAAWLALIAWRSRLSRDDPRPTAPEGPELMREIRTLEEALVDPARAWSGAALVPALRRYRRRCGRSAGANTPGSLGPLNPG